MGKKETGGILNFKNSSLETTDLVLSGNESSKPSYLIQKNAMSKAYYKISAMGKKLISMAMAVNNMQKTVLGDNNYYEAKFSFNDFFKSMGISIGGTSIERIVECADECVHFVINFHTDDLQNFIPLFSLIQIDKTNKILRFVFNPIINNFLEQQVGHHKINFLEYGKLRSTYAMRYYDIFEQYKGFAGKNGNPKNTWTCSLSFDEIKNLFQLDDIYQNRPDNFKKFVITEPIKELNEKITSMKVINQEWLKTGKKHTGVRFSIIKTEAGVSDYDRVSPYLNMIEEQSDRTLICQNADLYLSLLQKENCVIRVDLETASESTDENELSKLKLLCAMALNDLKTQKKQKKSLANASNKKIVQEELAL